MMGKAWAFQLNTVTDTLVKTTARDTTIQTGNSFLDEKVQYKASDSTTADLTNKKAYLYNNAEVYYENMILKAGYIEIDFEKKLVIAKGIVDSSGKTVQLPVFEQAQDKFVAGEIIYNFKTKKGKIKNVITQQGDGYIHGKNIKKDSSNTYYAAYAKYTTCDLTEPHYYISAKKIKVIPEDKTISGPAALYIADIPTPLVLPFGYFPNKKGRRSGILIPTYGEADNFGFFLRDGGFYFGMSEHVDLALRGSIYGNGSFGTSGASSYRKRYRYDGNVNLSYSSFIVGDAELSDGTKINAFNVSWMHNEDPKAHPNSRFSASVNAGSSFFNKYNGNPTGNYVNNQYVSKISYSKTFPGTPFNFSANAGHNQNTTIRSIDVTLPELFLGMSRINPFKDKNRTKSKWYDKVGVSADVTAGNRITTTDSLLFTEKVLNYMKNGVGFRMPVSTSFNVLKFFAVTPMIGVTSNIYFETIERHYDMFTKKIVTDTLPVTKIANSYNAGTSISTQVYGDYFFKTKRLKQIRHVARPELSMSYRPDFSESQYGYYKKVNDSAGITQQYSIFENGIYGHPLAGESAALNFSISNTLEAKTKLNSDSGAVFKKISLLESFGGSVSYNMAAEVYKWSTINLNARTRLLERIDVNTSANFDPYQSNLQGQQVPYLEWQNGRLARLTDVNLSLGTNLRSKEKKETKSESSNVTQDELDDINKHPEEYIDFDVPWTLNVNYILRYTPPLKSISAIKQKIPNVTQTLQFNGDLNLTKKWRIGVSSGYDLTTRKPTVTSVNVYRDLHCWEMHFNWVPFGFLKSFSVNINVKSAMLKDLQLKKRSKGDNAILY